MSCGLATRLARNLNRRTYHQNFTFRAMGAVVGAAHGGNQIVCQPRPPMARSGAISTSTRNHQSVQATMRISDSSDSRIHCSHESRFYKSGYRRARVV